MKEFIIVSILLLVLNFGSGKIKLIKYGIGVLAAVCVFKFKADLSLTMVSLAVIYSPTIILITLKLIHEILKLIYEKRVENQMYKFEAEKLIKKAFAER